MTATKRTGMMPIIASRLAFKVQIIIKPVFVKPSSSAAYTVRRSLYHDRCSSVGNHEWHRPPWARHDVGSHSCA